MAEISLPLGRAEGERPMHSFNRRKDGTASANTQGK